MKADQARQLSLQIKNQLITEKETLWLDLSKDIFKEIEKSVLLGKYEARLNLNTDVFRQIKADDYDFVKAKLELEGYQVNYILDKSPFGKRDMLISW